MAVKRITFDERYQELTKIIEEGSSNYAYANRAKFLIESGKYEEALSDIQKQEEQRSLISEYGLKIFLLQADCYMGMGEIKKAFEICNEAKEKYKKYLIAEWEIPRYEAKIYEANSEIEKAVEILENVCMDYRSAYEQYLEEEEQKEKDEDVVVVSTTYDDFDIEEAENKLALLKEELEQ